MALLHNHNSTRWGRMVGGLLAGACLALSSAGAQEPTAASASPEAFPLYEAIRPNVEFWKRVFTEWTAGQVAIHDSRHPGVVYEVLELPAPCQDGYTREQQERVAAAKTRWQSYLFALQQKIEQGLPLDETDKQWALYITTNGGSDATHEAHLSVRSQRGMRDRFRHGLETSGRYVDQFRQIFREAGLPEELAFLPHVESSFQLDARSSAGAVGVWQFTRGAGRRYMAVQAAIDERWDPVAAARGAARYLKDAYDQLGSWPVAITSYNHGVDGMQRAVAQHGADYERIYLEYTGRLFGFASKNFYPEFLAVREIALDPQRYFPEGFAPAPPLDLDVLVLPQQSSPARLSRAYGVALAELSKLNPAWTKRALARSLELPAGTMVWLPKGTLARMAETRQQPAPSAPVATAGSDGYHVVRDGETLASIAAAYGLEVTTLRSWNGMPPRASTIRVGQNLRVKAPARAEPASAERRHHVVRGGDTLMAIAMSYGVRLSDLLQLNRLTQRATIRPGQKLAIP
ncbi:MAG TPA: LysM peptidoglycan-binding domain-containing protein [Candidatus Polarisedimenticolaceae bacterium]|nr:LysM peptidoglycan-binding domain-containing protein [Candidatus Polarisedimenticolaceae bacterium]